MDSNDLGVYLPKYLSPETEAKLFDDLSQFPENIDERMYTQLDDEHVFQGDAISDLLVVQLPELDVKRRTCLILSNTCDLDPANKRLFVSHLMYCPIIDLNRYQQFLSNHGHPEEKIDSHLANVRKQRVTQIFYLPDGPRISESLVFLDHVMNNKVDQLPAPIAEYRVFSLSQYGFYLLLYKLSIHFTRMAEGVDRSYD